MSDQHDDEDEIIRQCFIRRERIARMEKELSAERGLRRTDAAWLVKNSDLTRSTIAAVLGISRVTLDKYIEDAGLAELKRDADPVDDAAGGRRPWSIGMEP